MKLKFFLLSLILIMNLTSCQMKPQKYQTEFTGFFDTYTIIVGYANSQSEFTKYSELIYNELELLHKYYDIYNNYENINNLKTINDLAGEESVIVPKEIIELLTYSKKMYTETNGIVNIGMGSVLKIWHDLREEINSKKTEPILPSLDVLEPANGNTNIQDLIIDEEKSTVFLKNKEMLLDVGAIAKGYAAEMAVKKAEEAGMKSALVSVGGNIVGVGKPLESDRNYWSVGVQNPNMKIDGTKNTIDTVFINDLSIVSSGGYERYFSVNGENFNHIIDPETLFPAEKYAEVTIIHKSSALADTLSTALFILSIEDGEILAKKFNAGVIWVYNDGSFVANETYKNLSSHYMEDL